MSKETYKGISRNKIPWDPKIDDENCIVCGKCVDFCPTMTFKFYEKEGEKRIAVIPNRCVVLCRGCEDICSEGAITHPSEKETQKLIDTLNKAKS
jgi:ferredoxin